MCGRIRALQIDERRHSERLETMNIPLQIRTDAHPII